MKRLFQLFGTTALIALGALVCEAPRAQAARQPLSVALPRDGKLVPLWRRPLVRQAPYRTVSDSFGVPAISTRHKLVVAGTAEGVLWGLSLRDGSAKWRRRVGVPIEAEVALIAAPNFAPSGELAVVGLHDGRLLAVDVGSGKKMWQATLNAEVRGAAVSPHPSVLVVTTVHNEVALLSLRTGEVRWVQGRAPPSGLSLQGHGRALVVGGRVFATFSDGFAAAYALRDGRELWSRPLSLRGGRLVDADAHPQWLDGKLIVASVSDGVYALRPSDGTTLWQQPLRHIGNLLAHAPDIYAASVEGQLFRLDPATGHQRARLGVGSEAVGALTALGKDVLLTAGDWGLMRLDAHGTPLGAQALGSRPGDGFAVSGPYVAHIARDGHLMVWQDTLHPAPTRRTVSQACSSNTGPFALSALQ